MSTVVARSITQVDPLDTFSETAYLG